MVDFHTGAETDEAHRVALLNLAGALTNDFRLKEAVAFNEDLVVTTRRIWGNNHEATILAEEHLAVALRATGTRETLTRSHEIQTRVYLWRLERDGRDHPSTVYSISILADVKRNLGMLVSAERIYKDVWATRRRTEGETSYRTLEVQALLIRCIADQGRFAEAHEMKDKLLPGMRRVLGPDHELVFHLLETFT